MFWVQCGCAALFSLFLTSEIGLTSPRDHWFPPVNTLSRTELSRSVVNPGGEPWWLVPGKESKSRTRSSAYTSSCQGIEQIVAQDPLMSVPPRGAQWDAWLWIRNFWAPHPFLLFGYPEFNFTSAEYRVTRFKWDLCLVYFRLGRTFTQNTTQQAPTVNFGVLLKNPEVFQHQFKILIFLLTITLFTPKIAPQIFITFTQAKSLSIFAKHDWKSKPKRNVELDVTEKQKFCTKIAPWSWCRFENAACRETEMRLSGMHKG